MRLITGGPGNELPIMGDTDCLKMTRTLRASGYVALTIQLIWGLVQVFAISPAGPGLPAASVGGHAHFGILSILATVTGFAIERTRGNTRSFR